MKALDSTKRRGKNNWWGSSSSISLHILCCLQTYSLVQRNLNKGVLICIGGGRFDHFLLQFSLSFGCTFPPPTFNLSSYKACKSLHERPLDLLLQRNLQGGGVIFWTIKVPTTLKKMGNKQSLSKSF